MSGQRRCLALMTLASAAVLPCRIKLDAGLPERCAGSWPEGWGFNGRARVGAVIAVLLLASLGNILRRRGVSCRQHRHLGFFSFVFTDHLVSLGAGSLVWSALPDASVLASTNTILQMIVPDELRGRG